MCGATHACKDPSLECGNVLQRLIRDDSTLRRPRLELWQSCPSSGESAIATQDVPLLSMYAMVRDSP